MPRLEGVQTPGEDQNDSSRARRAVLTRRTPPRAWASQGSESSTPGESFSSDKENHTSSRRDKRGMPSTAMGEITTPSTVGTANKRRRLGERSALEPSQASVQNQQRDDGETKYYDPEQPVEERRRVRKEIRDLARNLAGRSPRITNGSGSWSAG